MTDCIISPKWRQFVCRQCSRVISDCRPAGIPNDMIPTIEEIDSCAYCAKALKKHIATQYRFSLEPRLLDD